MSKMTKRRQKPVSVKLKNRILMYINTPISLSIYLRKKYQVAELPDVKPGDYLEPFAYQQDAQALALYSKSDDFHKSDLEPKAFSNWLASEKQCSETNDRFRLNLFKHKETRSVLYTAARYVKRVLGTYSFKPIDDIMSPGSTELLHGLDSNLISKFRSIPECTAHAYSKVSDVLLTHYLPYAISCGLVERDRGSVQLTGRNLNIVKGDSLLFINKSWKALRGICPQPLGNLIVQRCDSRQIRHGLKRHGLCLDTAPLLHEEWAKDSSINDTLSTIDLSAASDTIAYEFVKALLPTDWFDALCITRTRWTTYKGVTYNLEKFSAMGNGYTFELESLLFYSLCKAVIQLYGDKYCNTSVFGDDIIISSQLSSILIRVLEDCGFLVNTEKSFVTGPFKESCGKDFFNGHFVRPVYIKEQPKNEISRALYLSNRIFLISRLNDADGIVYDERIEDLRNEIHASVPTEFKRFGPTKLGDSVFHTTEYKSKYIRGIRTVMALVKKSRKFNSFSSHHHHLVCALYGIDSSGLTPRNSRYTYVVRSVVI